MTGQIVRRVAQAGLIVVLVASISFVLIHMAPGDPFAASMEHPGITDEMRARWSEAYGFDRPLHEQYWRYLTSVAQGDFGYSFSAHRPVSAALRSALPNTLLLMLVAIVASFAAGIVIGIAQAISRGRAMDHALRAGSLFFYSMPDFWLALVILLLFAYKLPLFPAGGMIDPVMYDYLSGWGKLVDRLHHLVLPALTLTLLTAAAIARYQRAAMLDILQREFVRTARAKGVPHSRIIFRHALRNALLPVITIFGLAFPALLGGAVFIEKVFAWPGMGLLAVNAIATRDYPLITATVIIGGIMVVAGNLLADLLYSVADPRLREH